MGHRVLICVSLIFLAFSFVSAQTNLITISQNVTSLTEAGGIAAITIAQSGTATTVVTFSVTGTAILNTDYSVSGSFLTYTNTLGSVRLDSTHTSSVFYLTAIDNMLVEGDRTVTLTLQTDVTYTISGTSSVTTTIVNNDFDNVTVATTGPTTLVENSGGSFTFVFTRTGSVALPLPVRFSIGGTAAFGKRWNFTANAALSVASNAASATITFPATATTASVNVFVIDDIYGQQPETIIFTIQPGSLYIAQLPDFAIVTILNDDPDTISITASPASVLSGSGTSIVYTATRAGTVGTAALSANFTLSGTASLGSDYNYTGPALTSFTGTLAWGVNIPSVTFSALPKAFTTISNNKTIIATLLTPQVGSGQNYTLSPVSPVATGTILNDVAGFSVAFSPSSINLNAGGSIAAIFTRSGYTQGAYSVGWAITGTALPNSDYTVNGAASISTSNGVVNFAAGVTSVNITLSIAGSTTIGSDKTIIFTLTSATGYTLVSPTSATATIVNDNRYPVSIFSSPTSISQDSTSSVVVTVSASGSIASALTVSFSVGGSAIYGTHYTVTGTSFSSSSGLINLASGNNPAASFQISPLPNPVPGAPSTIILTLVGGAGYTPSGLASTTISIINLPLPANTISVTVSPSTVDQNDNLPLVYTFVRAGATTSALNVNFNVSGTAVFGVDYKASGAIAFGVNSGTITFVAGSNLAIVSLFPILTLNYGTSKTATLSLRSSSTFLADSTLNTATGSITSNGVVTLDNLQSPTSSITGFALVTLLQPSITRIASAAIRVDVCNLLRLPSQFVDISENKWGKIIVKIFDVPNAASGATLATNLILIVNTGTQNVTRTVFWPAEAYHLPNSYLTNSNLQAQTPPIAIPPPPKVIPNGNGAGVGGKGNFYYYRPIVIVNAANNMMIAAAQLCFGVLVVVLATLLQVVLA